jgi:hypothetical protein
MSKFKGHTLGLEDRGWRLEAVYRRLMGSDWLLSTSFPNVLIEPQR